MVKASSGTGLENLSAGFCHVTAGYARSESAGFFGPTLRQIMPWEGGVGTGWALNRYSTRPRTPAAPLLGSPPSLLDGRRVNDLMARDPLIQGAEKSGCLSLYQNLGEARTSRWAPVPRMRPTPPVWGPYETIRECVLDANGLLR